jgi:hypothetical protein
MQPEMKSFDWKEWTQLKLWFKEKQVELPVLLYSASMHGWSNKTFHDRCDIQGATVTIVRLNNGAVFGGYSYYSFASKEGYSGDASKCFVFRLRDQKGQWNPFLLVGQAQPQSNAICCYAGMLACLIVGCLFRMSFRD